MTEKIDDAMWGANYIKPHLTSGEGLTLEQIAMNIIKNSEEEDEEDT